MNEFFFRPADSAAFGRCLSGVSRAFVWPTEVLSQLRRGFWRRFSGGNFVLGFAAFRVSGFGGADVWRRGRVFRALCFIGIGQRQQRANLWNRRVLFCGHAGFVAGRFFALNRRKK